MIPSRDIENNSFSRLYQNKVFFYFVLIASTLLIVLKMPMAQAYYETVSVLVTFAPMMVIVAMALTAYIKSKKYPDYAAIIQHFYLVFTLKFLVAIFVFYLLYSPQLFSVPLLAFFRYVRTLLTLESVFFFLSYLSTLVVAAAAIFVFFRAYQKSQGKYAGSMPLLTRRMLYSLFAFFFLIFVSSAAAYPQAYQPLTDTLGDTLYTLSSGSLKWFKGDDPAAYAKIESLGSFTARLSNSVKKTSQNIAQNNQDFKNNLDLASAAFKTSIAQSSKDLNDKLKADISGKVSIGGGEINGDLTLSGNNSDLTVEGTTTTKDIIPDSSLTYNLGNSGKSWNTIYAHRLIGASPIFIGNNASQKNLSATGDLVVSSDLEIQGILYAKNIQVNGAFTLPTTAGSDGQLLTTNGAGAAGWTTETYVNTAGDTMTGQLILPANGLILGATQLVAANGNIGINTASPDYPLTVSGTVKATAFMLPGGIYLNADSVSTNYWAESAGNIYRETGYVGLGNNDPQETLDVTGRFHLRQGVAPVVTTDKLWNTAGDLYWNGLKMLTYDLATSNVTIAGTVSASNFFDATNGVYLLADSINGNYWGESSGNIYRETGRVGIGTNSPTEKLDVAGNLQLNGNIFYGDTAASGNLTLQSTSNATKGKILFGTSAYDEVNNRLGLGVTTPSFDLSFGNNAAKTLSIEATANTVVGRALNISAGSTVTGGTADMAGGNLTLNSGLGKGTGASSIIFQTGRTLTTGSTLQTLTTAMTILGSGNVGIGTTNPTAQLQVAGLQIYNSGVNDFVSSSVTNNNLILQSNGTGSVNIKAGSNGFALNYNNSSTGTLHWYGGGTSDTFSVTSGGQGYFAGNVGIGTTTPGAMFQIAGTPAGSSTNVGLNVTDNSGNQVGVWISNALGKIGTPNAVNLAFMTNNAEKMRLYQSGGLSLGSSYLTTDPGAGNMIIAGNVGIGTASPGAKLEVYDGATYFNRPSAANNANTIGTRYLWGTDVTLGTLQLNIMGHPSATAGNRYVYLEVADSGDYRPLVFQPNGGNVGIGTTSPAGSLDVAHATLPILNIKSNQNNSSWSSGQEWGRLGFYTIDGTYGAHPAAHISVINDELSATTSPSGALAFFTAPYNDLTPNEALRISSTGNVGIGTTSPSTKLQISGTDVQTSGTGAVGVTITPTYNQTSGTVANTDLLINRTQTAVGSGAQLLIDAQVGGVSQFKVNNAGFVNVKDGGGYQINGTTILTGSVAGASTVLNSNGNDTYLQIYTRTMSLPNVFGIYLNAGTYTQTSGSAGAVKIVPTYNQTSGTAANTDLLINRTQTAVGSGAQLLIDAQVGGVSKFSVSNTGDITTGTGVLVVPAGIYGSSAGLVIYGGASGAGIANRFALQIDSNAYPHTQTSGTNGALKILPTYNQTSGTAANTDLLINRTQTAVGSGAQYLIDAQTGTTSMFNVSNIGAGYLAAASWTYGSDRRMKENITPLSYGLSSLMQLKPAQFDYISGQKDQLGFIAQDVQTVLPELVKTLPNGMLGLQTEGMIPVIVNAIQEQQAEIGTQGIQLADITLKTDQNITTVAELKLSVDTQLGVVGTSLSEIAKNQDMITKQISDINDQVADHETRIKAQEDLTTTLQKQIDDLKTQIAALDPLQQSAQLDLNTTDISFLNSLLGVGRVKDPKDIDLLGKLSAAGLETGQLTIKIIDPEAATIGTAIIKKGDTKITVTSKVIVDAAKIFVTPQTDKPLLWSVTDKKDGEFSIVIDAVQAKNISFDWWIVESQNQ